MTQYKVYKGFPYSFTARKARYYNITGSGVANDNTTLSYEMTPYAGLDTTVEYVPTATTTSTDTADVDGTITLPFVEPEIVYEATASTRNLVTIASGELPDYSTYAGARYCLGTTGESYLIPDEAYVNYTTYGSPTIDTLTGEISNFSSSNYITTPSSVTSDYFDLIQKVYWDTNSSENEIWFSSTDRPIGITGQLLGIYQGGWHQGTTVFNTAGDYWFRAIYDNTDGTQTVKLYWIVDDGYTLSTLPVIDDWNLELTYTGCTNPFTGVPIILSRNNSSYWKCKMYLDGSQISTADGVWWTPKADICTSIAGGLAEGLTDDGYGKDYNMFYKDGDVVFDTDISKSGYSWVGKFTMPPHQTSTLYQPNYTVTGSLTLNSDYTMSGFSASNYLTSTQSILTGTYFTTPYEIVARFYVTDTSSTQEIYFDESSNNHGVGISGSQLRAWVGSGYYGSTTLSTNTWYWVKTVFDGKTSTVYLSTDGETWSTEITYTGSIFGLNAIRFGNGYATTSEYLRGQLDLTSLKITTADTSTQTVWTALK